ncbi:MAG: aminopeptidase P family protein [Anaerolineae bacterium]|nr:aminopeptidase P family protein [Anaerolineae bacterium]
MAQVDTLRQDRLREQMKQAAIDALVCRLPENVVYITDYWPHHGFSFVVLPQAGKPLLFLPEVEADYAKPEWADVTLFGWGLLKDGDLYENYQRLLTEVRDRLGLAHATIGVEQSFEIVGSTYRAAEPVVPAAPWAGVLAEVFAGAKLVDNASLLMALRGIKTPYELEKMRTANEIAEMGMREFLAKLEPGMTEVEVGALVEGKIRAAGPGHKGARLVRANAEVGAGPVGSTRATLLVPSTTYVIKEGDLVMVELATVVDGYWSDLTYNAVAGGNPTQGQRDVYNKVLEAQQAGAAMMKPGESFAAPDDAARAVLVEADLGEYFPHITGHSVGLRYHEFTPVLLPGMPGTLQQGMVSSVEPGVYIPGWGGIRIEDNVAVGADGPIFLSTPRQPW